MSERSGCDEQLCTGLDISWTEARSHFDKGMSED